MGFWTNFLTGQPLEEKKESEACDVDKKPVEEKPKSVFDGGHALSKKDVIKLAGNKDLYGNVYNTGEYAPHREEIVKIIEGVLACKKNDYETFSKDEIRRFAVALKCKSDRCSQLAGRSLEDLLNK